MPKQPKSAKPNIPHQPDSAAQVVASPPTDQPIVSDTSHVTVNSDQTATARLVETEGASAVALTFASQTTVHAGPFPSPTIIRELEEIYPGAAKLIFEDFHAQSTHRRELEKCVIDTKNAMARRGQIIGGIIGWTGITGSLAVIGLGYQAGGTAVACTCLVALVGLFVHGQNAQKKELADKAAMQDKIKRGEPIEKVEASTAQLAPPKDKRQGRSGR